MMINEQKSQEKITELTSLILYWIARSTCSLFLDGRSGVSYSGTEYEERVDNREPNNS
jgi:hypothetical protein